MSTKEVIHHVRWKRRIANPNYGFLAQLEEFEQELTAMDNRFVMEVVDQGAWFILQSILTFAPPIFDQGPLTV